MQLNYGAHSVGDAFCVASFYTAINQAAESKGSLANCFQGTPRELSPQSGGQQAAFLSILCDYNILFMRHS